MALSKSISFIVNGNIEVNVDPAYLQIAKISGDKQKIEFFLDCKKDKNAFPFKTERYEFQPNLDGKNFISQAYEYLKTLAEFANAVDC